MGETLERATSLAIAWGGRSLTRLPRLRRAVLGAFERRLRRDAHLNRPRRHPPAVERDKLALGLALLALAERALREGLLSDAVLEGLLGRLVHDVLLHGSAEGTKRRFALRHGSRPPEFLTISPTRACNLRCSGCYADSGDTREALPWPMLERLVGEAHDLLGMRFFVLSGGEPLAYREQGKSLLDLAAQFRDCFFLMYTNGTLVDDVLAERLARLGNLSPGLSVEGLAPATNARRGAGVFERVVAAAERLHRARVLFGLSLTATRENADALLSDELVELFFERLGALYAWVFHYMPIGRAPALELMPTPRQRVQLYERVWHLVRERRLLVADFWNSATATNGCVAAGRAGGYFYVDWNGNLNPCVFVPYAPVTLHELFASGRTLEDAWDEPFFASLRRWQREYGYREGGEPYAGGGNWLRPCPIRDHHAEFRLLLDRHKPRAANEEARQALSDPAYARGLRDFGEELGALADPVWRCRYVRALAAPFDTSGETSHTTTRWPAS